MKFEIDYQFRPKGSDKLEDIGNAADLTIEDGGFGVVPEVGDFVEIPRSRMGEREVYYGKVTCRRFRYVLGYCHIRVILDEVDDATWRTECAL